MLSSAQHVKSRKTWRKTRIDTQLSMHGLREAKINTCNPHYVYVQHSETQRRGVQDDSCRDVPSDGKSDAVKQKNLASQNSSSHGQSAQKISTGEPRSRCRAEWLTARKSTERLQLAKSTQHDTLCDEENFVTDRKLKDKT